MASKKKTAKRPAAKRRARHSALQAWGSTSPTRFFGRMSGDEFSELVVRLLIDEVHRVGLRDGALDSFVAGNKGDGGVDAFLKSTPPRPSSFLPGNKAVFQFKRSCPKASTLFSELKKQARVRRLLADGADYVLVTGADVAPDAIEPLLSAKLLELVPSWRGRAEVWPASRVADACLRNSATWKLVVDPKLSTNLSSWAEWSRSPRLDADAFRWAPDHARTQILEAFYRDQTDSKRRSWRFIGAPGVGKSRLVLEATRHLRESVIVAPSFTSDVTHLMRDLHVGWIVVDECTDEQHESLVALAAGTDTRIITMGRDTQPSASASGYQRLPVMAWKETVQLVPKSITDPELRETIARSAGGYPKLLRLYARAIEARGATALTDDRGLKGALLDFLRHEFKTDQQALQCWALPSIATTDEVVLLAGPLEVSAMQIDKARKFLFDEGLLGSVGDGPSAAHYVTPILFAEWLAQALWDASGPRVLGAVSGASDRVRHECFRRLANGGPELKLILAGLDLERVVRLLEPAAVSDVASALAPSDPERALALVRRLLHRGAGAAGVRSTIWALRTLAWFPETFTEAVELLAGVVDGPTGYVLVDLFGTFMGVTRADGTTRMDALDRLSQAAPHWAVQCASEACEVERSRGTGGLPGTLEEAWRPKAREEERQYVTRAIATLCRLLEGPGDRSSAQTACTHAVRPLFARVLGEAVEPIVDAFVRLELPTTELYRAFELVEQFDLAQLGDERPGQEAIVQRYLQRLPSRTLVERIERLVDSTHWFRRSAEDPPPGASALAKELAESEGAAEVLRSLAGTRGPGPYEFGRLCSRADREARLLPLQLGLAAAAAHHQFAVGYFFEWPAERLDPLLTHWARESSLGPFVFDLIHRLGGSDYRARLVIDLIDRELLPRARLGDLYMGAWLWNVSDPLALRLLERTPLPSRLLVADQWCRNDPSRVSIVVDAWHAVHGSDLESMVDHVWGEIAVKAREQDPARFSATMVERLREAGESQSSARSLAQVLSDWLAVEPDAIARILSAAHDDQRVMWPIRDLSLSPGSAAAAVEWARQRPDSAWLVTELSSGFDELALALLEAVPGSDRLAGALSARARTGHFWGSGTEFWTARAEQLERLGARASLTSTRRWFVAHSKDARKRARHAQQQERAYEEGVIPLPFVANR